MIYTVLSLALFVVGLVCLARSRSRKTGTLAAGLSYIVASCSIILWPENHSLAFDAATHVPGLGRLVNDTCATSSVMLQFVFISLLARAWSRWRRIAIVGYGVLLAVSIALWVALHLTFGSDLSRHLYIGYAAGPLLVRIWNTVIGVAILYSCVLALVGYARATGKIHNRFPRLTTATGTTTYGMASLYGILVSVQLVAAWLGRGDIGLKRFLGPIVVVCLVAVLANAGLVLVGRRVLNRLQQWHAYARQWYSLSEKQAQIARSQAQLNRSIERLEQLLNDNINAASVANDQRVYLDKYADGDLIDEAEAHLQAHSIPAFHRKASRQALRYLVLNRANAVRPLYDEEAVQADDEDDAELVGVDDDGLLADLSRIEQEHIHLFADAARIAGLVILMQRGENLVTGRLSELEPRPELDGWHRTVATLIVEVLRARARERAQSPQITRLQGDSVPGVSLA